jgi:hypothetical protein
VSSGQPPIIAFQRNSTATGIDYLLEISRDLEIWTAAPDQLEALDEASNGDSTTRLAFKWKEGFGERAERM